MASVYARVTKINNAAGRSSYINNQEKQENIVLQKSEKRFDWEFYSNFEQSHKKSALANNEALEVIVALPNSLSDDKTKLALVCDDLKYSMVGPNHDYEYAVHWNHTRSNLHVHILFSEREVVTEAKPKVYKKDIWHDKDTHKLAKANSENAELIHKKGEVQIDRDGNIKYDTEPLSIKDTKFVSREWLHRKNEAVKEVLGKYGYELENHTRQTPYLSQKKLYKGASADYLQNAEKWNSTVKQYNQNVRSHIELEPAQEPVYLEIRNELEINVKEANSESKKITPKAIELVQDMSNWVRDLVTQLKMKYRAIIHDNRVQELWQETKGKFYDLFEQGQEIKSEKETLQEQNEQLQSYVEESQAVIDSKNDLIEEMEERSIIRHEYFR